MHFATSTVFTLGQEGRASSTTGFAGMLFAPRRMPSLVITMTHCESLMRSTNELALKPPKTTEWMAPMRAQASTLMASSGIMGM